VNPPKMPIHIGDLLRDTSHLRAPGMGAYLLLLFHHWSTGELPNDDDQLAAIARLTRGEWKKMRPIIEKFFQPGWVHGRVLDDLADAKESYEKLAAAGSKGGKAKANNKRCLSDATSDASADATASLKQPLTFNQSKKEDAATAAPPYAFESGVIRLNQRDFEQWKGAYSHLDLAAELLSLSEWASQQRSWFNAVKGALAKRNRDARAVLEKQSEQQQPFKWNGVEGVI
jgi:uncharacterized protein YdaU (DUF1376 family)